MHSAAWRRMLADGTFRTWPVPSSPTSVGRSTSEGEEAVAEAGHEVLHIAAPRVPVEAGKAGPAERQGQVVEEGQPMPLVCDQRVGTGKWNLDAVWAAAADVGLVEIVRRQIDTKRM